MHHGTVWQRYVQNQSFTLQPHIECCWKKKEQVIFSPWRGSNWKWSWSTCHARVCKLVSTICLCARNLGQTIPEQSTKDASSILTRLCNEPPLPLLHAEVHDRQTEAKKVHAMKQKKYNTNQTMNSPWPQWKCLLDKESCEGEFDRRCRRCNFFFFLLSDQGKKSTSGRVYKRKHLFFELCVNETNSLAWFSLSLTNVLLGLLCPRMSEFLNIACFHMKTLICCRKFVLQHSVYHIDLSHRNIWDLCPTTCKGLLPNVRSDVAHLLWWRGAAEPWGCGLSQDEGRH